ncbi:hypothetical protein A9G42_07210 [Gilliamella sp. Nev6-6]|uniref:SMI1/KNR4 family protein n=1 Tax=Gilliamella sp. Nev6-6 TaxID=3120252 RepID=UPI00080F3D8F|nr:SMI1/KNR4 family protein [Gilliamella apicola]OCG76743.1 hypothetical protein A9G42_07210 [Gilliamella apicola]
MQSKITPNDVKKLIDLNSHIINFGSPDNAPSSEWINKAESYLHVNFSDSYKWFLAEYGGGDINGEEIFSIYEMDFENAIGGDIVYNYIIDIRDNLHDKNEIVVSRTDFGEEFYFNYNKSYKNECPIYLRLGKEAGKIYTINFYEFLYKRIKDLID